MLARQLQVLLEALGQPGAARPDADQRAVGLQQALDAAREVGVERFRIEVQCAHGCSRKNCSRINAALAASRSRAPWDWASALV